MEMFYDIRKLRNGKSDAIERSQTITVLKPIIKKNNPKSVGIKALVIGALWMALLYSEGIVGMELESFGVGFVLLTQYSRRLISLSCRFPMDLNCTALEKLVLL